MKTKEELNALKKEVEILNKKLAELTEDELSIVTGGVDFDLPDSSVKVEVGKWYKKVNENDCPPSPTPFLRSTCHWYCAEDLGGKKFRFEVYVSVPQSDGNNVSRMDDQIAFGIGFENYSAPFPLPR